MYFIAFLLSQASVRTANANYEYDYPAIRQFIYWVETDNREALSKHVEYPLSRSYPIPDIENAQEFIERYDEIFDKHLIGMIVNSDLGEDWKGAGWRGVMLKLGQLWLHYDGELHAINYKSEFEQAKQIELIDEDRTRLHPSVRKFKRPIFEWKTKSYIIRVDELDDGDYRYASWSIGKKLSDKPDLVLNDGKRYWQGSGGNHNYDFINGKYIHRIEVNILGKYEYDELPGDLDIYESEKLIFREPAKARWENGRYIPSDASALSLYED
jgi:hypothetical protein